MISFRPQPGGYSTLLRPLLEGFSNSSELSLEVSVPHINLYHEVSASHLDITLPIRALLGGLTIPLTTPPQVKHPTQSYPRNVTT